MGVRIQFRCVDAAVIRMAAFGSEWNLPPWPDLTGGTPEHVREWRSWLARVWEQEALVAAIEVASPVLARCAGDVCGGQVQQPRRVRRVVESVIRYLMRLTSRATPFGLFAGVAALRVGSAASVRWGGRDHTVARPDAGWLAEVITRLEARPEILRCLPVVASNLGFVRGDRLVVPCQQPPGVVGEVRPADVSVRYTRAVQAVIEAARSPITVGELIGKLAAELAGRPPTEIEGMLTKLVSCRILVTSLHPPMDVTDPLGHVIDQVTAGETGAAPLSMLQELRMIRGQLSRHDQASSPGTRRALRASVSRRMSAICDRPGPSLAVDLRVDCSVVLPQAVAREAEAAASVLVRLTPHPMGNPAWRAWHARFLERYGSGAVVPVAEIVNTDTGLGYPAGYRGSEMTPPTPSLSARDRTLLQLAQRAALDGCGEVVLDDHELVVGSAPAQPHQAPPHTELRFILHAAATEAVDRGEFTLVVVSAARQAGTTTGRFLHLLHPEDRDRMAHALTGLPTLVPGSLLAQVSCPPLSPRTGNLARTPAMFPPIPLGEHRPDGAARIPLDDLAVSGDAHRLFLVSLSQGCVVEPLMVNAVEFRRATHPLARFLCEITTARAAACVPFAWGAANGLPFLPRVRHGRTVLCPASWHLSASDLPRRRATWREWSQAWSGLRHRYRIPETVHLGEHDVRLRLDLNEPAHLAVLRTHLDRAGNATVTEASGPHDYGWTGGHAHEIIIPLATQQPPAPLPVRSGGSIRVTHHPGHPPGSSAWLYARLYGHSDRQTDILTTHLPDLLSTWEDGPAEDWWFLRCREPEPHLRLRIRLHDARHYGAATQRIGAWADRIRQLGLLRNMVLDTYYPEVGRYGTGAALHAAEVVFAADSTVTIAQLTMMGRGDPHPHAVTAASFTDLAAAFTGGVSNGLRWLLDHLKHHPAPTLARNVRDQAMRLADPSDDWAALRALPGGELLAAAWAGRRSALAAYRTHLSEAEGPEPDRVLASLLHLHHARMVGIDPDSERACFRLARAAALGWAARHERSTPSPSPSPAPTRQPQP